MTEYRMVKTGEVLQEGDLLVLAGSPGAGQRLASDH